MPRYTINYYIHIISRPIRAPPLSRFRPERGLLYALRRAGVFRFCEWIYLPRLALDGTDRDYVTTTRRRHYVHSRDETGVRSGAFLLGALVRPLRFARGIISGCINSWSINPVQMDALDLLTSAINCSSI